MQTDGEIPPDALSEEQEALQLMRSGHLEKSRDLLEELCMLYPHRAKFHFNHALALYKLKQYKESLQEVTIGLKLQPDDEKAIRFKQALVVLVGGAASGEVPDVRSGPGKSDAVMAPDAVDVASAPENSERSRSKPAPPTMFEIRKSPGQPPRDDVETSTQEYSKVKMAEVLGVIQKIGAGLESSTIKDDDPSIKEKIAMIKQETQFLYEHAHYEQALTIYTMFLRYFPDDLEVLFNSGFCLREMQNYAEAETTFKHIIDVFYDNAYAWYNLALIYALTNDEDKETYCLQKASEFGYHVNTSRLYSLNLTHVPKNPFDTD
jgi:tetratricopeptide (TPR) repeat protein